MRYAPGGREIGWITRFRGKVACLGAPGGRDKGCNERVLRQGCVIGLRNSLIRFIAFVRREIDCHGFPFTRQIEQHASTDGEQKSKEHGTRVKNEVPEEATRVRYKSRR